MADMKLNSSADGIGRQEEEVRDLFNLLTKTTPAEKTGEESLLPTVEQTSEAEDVNEGQAAAADEIVLPTAEAQDVFEMPEEPTKPEPMSEEQLIEAAPVAEEAESEPIVPAPAATVERRAVAFVDDDEDDVDVELPPLILTSYDDEEDDSDADEFDDYDQFILTSDDDADDYAVDEAPAVRCRPLIAIWNALRSNVPLPCDGKMEVLRKSVFWLSLVVVVGALTYILYNVWWLPSFTKGMYEDVNKDYHPELVGVVEESGYPYDMQLSFKSLYERNRETRGWLSFHASGNQDFLNIEYPIMYSGDNTKYLTIDFNGNKNKNGALFFDMRANLQSYKDVNTSLIVYGHNMASGQMLAGLNKFIGNVNNARVAPTMTMNTLFADGEYKVFAVVITDESAQPRYYYNVRRTQFSDNEDFLTYIENLRARSLFDYPVDVQAGDELLLLSTCTVPSSAKIQNGRLTVIARKVRPSESTWVNTSAIVKNEDVIMPYAWYTQQKQPPHVFYSGNMVITTTTSTATTTGSLFFGDMTSTWDSTAIPSGDMMSTTLPTGDVSTTGSTTLPPVSTSSSASTAATGSATTASTTAGAATQSTAATESTTENTTTESTTTESTTTTTTTTVAAEEEPPAAQE